MLTVFQTSSNVALLVALALLTSASCSRQPLPSVAVPRCDTDSPATLSALFRSNGSSPFPARTAISLCWTPDNLLLEYDCQDDVFLRNDFSGCNSPMYNQEVVEVFIAPRGLQDATSYLEVETTPYSALYASHISNPYLNGTISHTLIACNTSGIEHFSSQDARLQKWRATIAIPWLLVNSNASLSSDERTAAAHSGDNYRVNFFRISMRNSVSACSDSDCDYGAWSPTMHNPPSFHQPKYFGVMQLL